MVREGEKRWEDDRYIDGNKNCNHHDLIQIAFMQSCFKIKTVKVPRGRERTDETERYRRGCVIAMG